MSELGCHIKILIAEDDMLNRMMLEKLMQKFGVVCMLAKNGQEAVDFFDTDFFDAVFLDVNMPVYSGPECADIIRKKAKDREICDPFLVCISADEDYMDSNIFDFFLAKPFDMSKIKELVDTITSGKCIEVAYDINKVSEVIGLDVDTMLMLMEEFISVMDEEIVNLRVAISKKDSEMTTHVAHKMKGASANMQVEPLREYCAEMQNINKNDFYNVGLLFSKIYCSYCMFKKRLNS